ncbi:FIST C-terminal domain-containing protein [Chitinophagales bacterium]|nr:FIST C-terminal domain-containing protein [Chitinophagales bacterium]
MYIQEGTIRSAQEAIATINPTKNEAVFCFVGEKHSMDLPEMVNTLQREDGPVIGAVFPSVIGGGTKSESGMVLKKETLAGTPVLIREMSSVNSIDHCDFSDWENVETVMILLDGLSTNIGQLLSLVYNKWGNKVHYVGAGAGSLSLVQMPCLFIEGELVQDAAILIPMGKKYGIGVDHGWDIFRGPLIANKTDGNSIIELNWRNAFEVYAELVEAETETKIIAEDFFDTAKAFPLGFPKQRGAQVVRDPISVDEKGVIHCIGAVPENTVLQVLKGDAESIVSAAQNAGHMAIKQGGKNKDGIVFDCISRVLFLAEDFKKELAALQDLDGNPLDLEGALTMGEISSPGEGYLELYNKTIVIALPYE